MANLTVLALDEEKRDLCFDENGMMMLLEDGAAIAQNIRNNLYTWRGEFPLNTGHGTDWQRVVALPLGRALDEADDVIRASVFQEPYLREIDQLTPKIDGRSLGVEFSGTLYDGSVVRLEVKTG